MPHGFIQSYRSSCYREFGSAVSFFFRLFFFSCHKLTKLIFLHFAACWNAWDTTHKGVIIKTIFSFSLSLFSFLLLFIFTPPSLFLCISRFLCVSFLFISCPKCICNFFLFLIIRSCLPLPISRLTSVCNCSQLELHYNTREIRR